MNRTGLWLMCVVCLTALTLAQVQIKYGVKVVSEAKVDFTKFKLYSWTAGQPAPLKSIDQQIVAAIDTELGKLGMSKAASGPGDVLVGYGSLRRTDVQAKPDTAGNVSQYSVGTLYVVMLEPGTRRKLLELRLDKPIETDMTKAKTTIDGAVAELFTQYPTVRPKK